MNENNKEIALKYYKQAEYFMVAAQLASEHKKANYTKNPIEYNNFETVIVGTHHAFSEELLIKGIIVFYRGNHHRVHKIKDLLNDDSCRELKESMKNKFQPTIHTSYAKEILEPLLNQYCNNLNKNDKRDEEEIEALKKIMCELEFGSFDYFLELHSNHFVKMRYACEKDPPPLDMNFTSFLTQQLRDELKKLLGL